MDAPTVLIAAFEPLGGEAVRPVGGGEPDRLRCGEVVVAARSAPLRMCWEATALAGSVACSTDVGDYAISTTARFGISSTGRERPFRLLFISRSYSSPGDALADTLERSAGRIRTTDPLGRAASGGPSLVDSNPDPRCRRRLQAGVRSVKKAPP
jgi:hypothetical protein